jgi:hypothetical protein
MLHACLYTICFVFCYTSWRFYAFYGTNLLTRRHSVSSLFLLFLCFRKATQEIFSELNEIKAKIPSFSRSVTESKAETKGCQEAAAPCHGAGHPLAAPGYGVRPWPTLWRCSSAYIFPSTGKPKELDQFPRNILQAAAIVDARLGGSRSSSQHPIGEGNHRWRPSSSPCLPPEWCLSSLPWTTGP